MPRFANWKILGLSAVLIAVLMLGLLGGASAQIPNNGESGAGKPPFANAIDQRQDMIRELREIKELIKEQNALLKQYLEKGHDASRPKK